MTKNARIDQLAVMLGYIVNIEYESAVQIVESTEVGKRILENDFTIMYEQETENLAEIADELRTNAKKYHFVSKLTSQNIAQASKKYREKRVKGVATCNDYKILKKDNLGKSCIKEQLKSNEKNLLKRKKQNQINARRIEKC